MLKNLLRRKKLFNVSYWFVSTPDWEEHTSSPTASIVIRDYDEASIHARLVEKHTPANAKVPAFVAIVSCERI